MSQPYANNAAFVNLNEHYMIGNHPNSNSIVNELKAVYLKKLKFLQNTQALPNHNIFGQQKMFQQTEWIMCRVHNAV